MVNNGGQECKLETGTQFSYVNRNYLFGSFNLQREASDKEGFQRMILIFNNKRRINNSN